MSRGRGALHKQGRQRQINQKLAARVRRQRQKRNRRKP